jgi:hypothetical protein
VLNSTGKVALNSEAIARASPEKLQARMPGGRASPEPNLSEGLRFAQSEVNRNELAGALRTSTRAHPAGAPTGHVTLSKPAVEPTSGRGRILQQADKHKVVQPTRMRANAPQKADSTAAKAVAQEHCVSAPLPSEPAAARSPKKGKSTGPQPTLPAFRHPLKDSDYVVKLKKEPKDTNGIRYKYDRIYLPPYRSGNTSQVAPYMNGFQHIAKCPKQQLKKPLARDPVRAAKNVVIDLAAKVRPSGAPPPHAVARRPQPLPIPSACTSLLLPQCLQLLTLGGPLANPRQHTGLGPRQRA